MSKFGGMGNCFPFVRKHQKGNKEISLAIVGLDNAGKTTTAKSIQGETLEGIGPTVGFDRIEFCIGKFNISLFDLGGGKGIRAIWKNYLSEVYGLIYVIDSSDPLRLEEARDNLEELFNNEKVKEKPVLLLANKQDKECALDEGEIVEILNLVQMINENQIPCRLERCAAVIGVGKKMDKPIKNGLRWLLGYIDANLDALRARIDIDVAEQLVAEAEEKERKRERVRQRREEREREREARGELEEPEAEVEGDPFKPLNVEDLKKQEQVEKARRRAEAPAATTTTATTSGASEFERTPAPLEREEPPPPPVLAGSTVRGQFYSPRGPTVPPPEENGDTPRPPNHLAPLKSGGLRLEPLEPAGSSAEALPENGRRKKKKKRSRLGRKNRLAPDPAGGGAEGEASGEDGDDGGGSGLSSRTPSRPDLFVTEKIFTLDELDEDDTGKHVERIGPNSDSDVALR